MQHFMYALFSASVLPLLRLTSESAIHGPNKCGHEATRGRLSAGAPSHFDQVLEG